MIEPSREDFDEEAALRARLRAGDDQACEMVVRRHAPRMLATAMRLLRDEHEAQDAVQDAFASAFRAIDAFAGASTLGTWLHRIVVNAALMKLRTRRRHPEVALEDLAPRFREDGHRIDPRPAWSPVGAARLEQEEARARVALRLAQLPPPAREVILLRDIEGLDTAATAAALGVTEGAVKVRLHRARLALRALLEQDFAPAA